MNNWKRKKTTNSKFYILIIIFILISIIGISYAKFQSTLTIHGTIQLIPTITTDLPIEIVPNNDNNYIDMEVDDGVLEITNQNVIGNTINITLQSKTQTGKPRVMISGLNFFNNTDYTYTNGNVTREISGNIEYIDKEPQCIISPTIEPGETGSLNITFPNLKFNHLREDCEVKFIITYNANGQTVKFNLLLKFVH